MQKVDAGTAVHTITAAVLRANVAETQFASLTVDALRPDEVLVRLVATGVCHTDLTCREGFMALPRPIILGHEGAGIVEQIGAAVTTLKPGDPVVLTFAYCSECRSCTSGHPAYCEQFVLRNFTGRRVDGSTALRDGAGDVSAHFFCQSSFASHSVVNARSAVKVRADAPLDMLGPLGCGFQTGAGAVFNVLRPEPGTSLAVFGAGGVGLSAVMAAAVTGCDPILVVEPNAERRALALELGASHALDPNDGEPLVERIATLTNGGAGTAIDTTGLSTVIAQAIEALAGHGGIALVSTADPAATLPGALMPLMLRGITVHGVSMGDSDPHRFIPDLVDLVMAGKLPIEKLIRFYDFTAIDQAFEDQRSGAVVKPVVRMST